MSETKIVTLFIGNLYQYSWCLLSDVEQQNRKEIKMYGDMFHSFEFLKDKLFICFPFNIEWLSTWKGFAISTHFQINKFQALFFFLHKKCDKITSISDLVSHFHGFYARPKAST